MKALIIVDLQHDFLPGGALAVEHSNLIIPIVNNLQPQYDLVVATQDWHPSNHKSFASQHRGRNTFEVIDLNGLSQTLWPDHCVQGTSGAALTEELDQQRIEAIFRKGLNPEIDSYSGFFDNDRRKNTGLHGYLQDRNITEVHVCGLAADFCVHFTAMDALELGYRTAVVTKATKAINKSDYISKKEDFVQRGGFFA
jgi:nicotinamidase/pyrazinamidase